MNTKRVVAMALIASAIMVTLAAFLYQQYQSYIMIEQKTAEIAPGFSTQYPYTIPPQTEILTIRSPFTSAADLKKFYNVTTFPKLNFELKDFSEDAYMKSVLTKEVLDKYREKSMPGLFEGTTDEDFLTFDTANPANETVPAVILKSGQLKKEGTFSIVFTSRTPNLWSYVLGKPRRVVPVSATISYLNPVHSEEEYRIDKYISNIIHTKLVEDMSKGQRLQDETCPYLYLDKKFGAKKPSSKEAQDAFSYTGLLCSLRDDLPFTGEQITVEIYTQDIETGKQAFREALAKDGFKESDKLRIVFIHKPKS